jgi:hypothetical protein
MNLEEAEKLIEGVDFDFQGYYEGIATFAGRVNGFDVEFSIGGSTYEDAYDLYFTAKRRIKNIEYENIAHFTVRQNGTVVFSWDDPEW